MSREIHVFVSSVQKELEDECVVVARVAELVLRAQDNTVMDLTIIYRFCGGIYRHRQRTRGTVMERQNCRTVLASCIGAADASKADFAPRNPVSALGVRL